MAELAQRNGYSAPVRFGWFQISRTRESRVGYSRLHRDRAYSALRAWIICASGCVRTMAERQSASSSRAQSQQWPDYLPWHSLTYEIWANQSANQYGWYANANAPATSPHHSQPRG